MRVRADVGGGPVAEALDVQCLAFGWPAEVVFGVCDAIEADADTWREVERDAGPGGWAGAEVGCVYGINASEERHGREKDVDVRTIRECQLLFRE